MQHLKDLLEEKREELSPYEIDAYASISLDIVYVSYRSSRQTHIERLF